MKKSVLIALAAFTFTSSAHAFEDSDLNDLGISPDQQVTFLSDQPFESLEENAIQSDGDTIREVPNGELRLAGRGFMNRDTQESIAIACVGKDLACDKLRFIYVNSKNHKAYYVGSSLEVSSYVPAKKAARMNDDQQRKFAIKKAMKNFKSWRRQNKGLSSDTKNMITALGFMGTLVIEAVGAAVVGPWGLAISGFCYPFYLVVVPMITGDIKLMNGNQTITNASYDQNGFNWSGQPATVRAKVFNQLFEYLTQYRQVKFNLREGN